MVGGGEILGFRASLEPGVYRVQDLDHWGQDFEVLLLNLNNVSYSMHGCADVGGKRESLWLS